MSCCCLLPLAGAGVGEATQSQMYRLRGNEALLDQEVASTLWAWQIASFMQSNGETYFLGFDMNAYDCHAVQGIDLVQQLIDLGQEHLFDHWPAPGVTALLKHQLCRATCCLLRSYGPEVAFCV